MKRLEILLLVVLGGFAALFLLLSRDYNPTAALFPRIIAIAALVFLSLTVIRGQTTKSPKFDCDPSRNLADLVVCPRITGLQAGYIVLIYAIGFFAATFLYLAVAPIQLRYERRGVAILTSLLLTLGLTGSFMWLFSIELPTGAIWQLW